MTSLSEGDAFLTVAIMSITFLTEIALFIRALGSAQPMRSSSFLRT